MRVDRGECDVIAAEGRVRVISDSQRAQDVVAPATGDWVVVVDDPELGPVIGRVLDRSNTVSRRDPSEAVVEQVLVANVDLVLIVHGLDRPLPPGRLERFLVIGWDSGAEVAVVLTKADRNAAAAVEVAAVVSALAPEVRVLTVGMGSGVPEGLREVEALMGPGRTVALLGESGAGKSTLVRAVVDRLEQRGIEVALLPFDDYYHDHGHLEVTERALVNYDHPDSLDLERFTADLEDLAGGRSVDAPVYDLATHCRLPTFG